MVYLLKKRSRYFSNEFNIIIEHIQQKVIINDMCARFTYIRQEEKQLLHY